MTNGPIGPLPISRRTFLRSAAATAGAVALAGCGTTNSSGQPSISKKATRSRNPVTVTLWNPSGDALGDPIIKRMSKDYNATIGRRQGIHLDDNPVSDTSNNVKFTEAMNSSTSPDLVQTYTFNPVVSWAATGLIRPLDTLASELHVKESDYFPFVWDMQHFAGHTWGLLQEWDADLLFWNSAIHTGKPPTTIGEIDALSQKYTKFSSSGALTQVGLIPWAQGGFSSGGYGDWGAIWGAEFYDDSAGKWTITKPQNQRFLNWYLKYLDMVGGVEKANALISSVPSTYAGGIGSADIFNYGKSAFCMLGEWFPKELVATAGRKVADSLPYKIQPHLISAEGVNSGKEGMVTGANLFLIPQRAKQPDAAANVLNYFVEPAQLTAWATPIGQGQPTPTAARAPALIKALPFMTYWANAAAANYFMAEPQSPAFATFDTAMGTAIDGLTKKKYTPAQALSYVDNQVSSAVSQFQQANPTWHRE